MLDLGAGEARPLARVALLQPVERDDGADAHHLLDPATGRPVHSGLVQVSALAPTALEAEVLAKWALLRGPDLAEDRLIHGGVTVDDSGAVREIVGSARCRAAHSPSR